jgi:hypothetical protein
MATIPKETALKLIENNGRLDEDDDQAIMVISYMNKFFGIKNWAVIYMEEEIPGYMIHPNFKILWTLKEGIRE